MLLCYEKFNIINARILYVRVGIRVQEFAGIISGMAAMDFRDSNAVPSQRVVQIQFSTLLIALRPLWGVVEGQVWGWLRVRSVDS